MTISAPDSSRVLTRSMTVEKPLETMMVTSREQNAPAEGSSGIAKRALDFPGGCRAAGIQAGGLRRARRAGGARHRAGRHAAARREVRRPARGRAAAALP